MRFRLAAIVLFLAVGYVPTGFANPFGTLNVGNCLQIDLSRPGGGVTISGPASGTPNFINWIPDGDAGAGTGCIITGTGTLVGYVDGGPLGPGLPGGILDIPTTIVGSVRDFMSLFEGNYSLHFDLR